MSSSGEYGRVPGLVPLKLAFLFVSLALLTTMANACQYRYVGNSHSMCIYSPRACPGSKLLRSGGVTSEDARLILGVHNHLRSVVASGQERGLPAAANMKTMSWDNELATVAQRWADQCQEGHDKNRDVSRFEVGQNVAVVWTYDNEDLYGDEPDWETQVRSWYEELYQFGFGGNMIKPFRYKASTGHLTQVLWAETNKVGCGFAYYYGRQKGYTKIYVCNYGPGGNFIGSTMYEPAHSPTCIGSDLLPSRHFPGLCDQLRDYDDEGSSPVGVAVSSRGAATTILQLEHKK